MWVPVLAGAEPANPKVIERYKQMLMANPVEGVALDRLWKSAMDAESTDELLAEYAKVETFAGRMILGHLLRKAGKDAEAAKAYGQAAALDPKSPLPPLALSRLGVMQGKPSEAAALLENALKAMPENDPRVADSLMQLGAAWLNAGEPGKAAAAWERTAKLDPGNLDLRRRLATTYADNFLPEQAIAHLEYIVEHGPVTEKATSLQQIARLYSASGRPGEAMKALEKAVAQTAPTNWLRGELLGQIIRIAQRQRVEDDLEAKWLRQVEQAPRDIGGYLQLVEFYERTGALEKQREWLEKLVALTPRTAEYRLKLARLHVALESLDKASVLYDELIAAQPGNADLAFERARLDLQRENSDAARSRVAALLKSKPDDAGLRTRALEFFQEHHLHDQVEQQLKHAAGSGEEDALFALATFYFGQRRVPEGLSTLKGLSHPEQPAEKRAAIAFRTAQLLKAQGELGSAVETVESAIALQPDTRDFHLLLGELQNTRTQYEAARAALEKAHALSRTDADRMEVDGRIFQGIREMHSAPTPEPELPWTRRDPSRREPAQAAVEDYIRGLMTLAVQEKSARAWLRVAQWKAWNGDKASAVTFGSKASEIDPKDPAPHEFLARHSAANGDPGFALLHLRQLLELNPAGRAGYLREIAQLHSQRGNVQEALSVYGQIARDNPGNASALVDLAAAQERARQLDESASTLRKALALLPAGRKREASSALLRVLQELGQHEEACTMLLRAVEETGEDRERIARFDELLLYSQQHGRMEWLRVKFEERRKLRADDYFTSIALGRILKVLGEKAAAFELFADAALSAPNQAEALPELIREAEDLQRLDTAVKLQEQFTRIAPQEGPDGFIKLAALCERTGDLDGAERAWQRAVGKFPRDVEVLRRASDFHLHWGDAERATVLLRKLLSMDPANARVASSLGTMEYEAGRLPEARAAFETVMKLTRPVTDDLYPPEVRAMALPDGDAASRPLARRIASLPSYSLSKRSPDAEMRLGALRSLGAIAQRTGGPELQQWLAAWEKSPDGTEPLWALYFAGAKAQTLERIQGRMRAEPANPSHLRAWVWIALESGAQDRISQWLGGQVQSSAGLSIFSDVFAEFVQARPELVDAAALRTLFPPGARTRISQSAVALSAAKRFPEAIGLGTRVFEIAGTQRPNVGRELARMHLAAGNSAEAAKVLLQATEGTGEWFDSPVYEAMRDYCMLVDEPAREAFIRTRLEMADSRTVHGLITRVLLHGMAANEAEAMSALNAVLASRPMIGQSAERQLEAAARHWIHLKNASNTLVGWGLPSLASAVWDYAFADEGYSQIQMRRARKAAAMQDEESMTVEALVADGRVSRDALLYLSGGPAERGTILAGYAANARGMDRLTEMVEALGALDAAVEIATHAWERSPDSPGALRRAMDACNAAGDEATAERIRRKVLDDRLNPGGDSTPTQFAAELSQQLEARGDIDGALKVIETGWTRNPMEMSLARRHAMLLQLSGANEQADAEIRKLAASDGGNAHSRELLAQMLQRQGKMAEALAFRKKNGNVDAQLPLLLYRFGQPEEARASLEKLTGSYAVAAAMTLAEAMGLAGDAKSARSVLIATAGRVLDARSQLQLRSKLLRIPGAPPTPLFAARMEAKLRKIIASQPELTEPYHEFFDRHAARFGIAAQWEATTAQAWAGGTGALPAGLSVLRQRIAANDAAGARKVCDQIAARGDATGPVMDKAMAALAAAKLDELRLVIAETAARKGWPRSDGTLAWVRTLREMGRGEQAREILKSHAWLAMFDGGAAALGSEWLEVGDPAMAALFTRRALAAEALHPSTRTLVQMARIHTATKRLPAARLLLRRAFARPSCREYDALAEYLDTAGDLPNWEAAVADFTLHPAAQHGLKLAIFARLEKRGRVAEALAFAGAHRSIISPLSDDTAPGAVTPGRIRLLATQSGAFAEAAQFLKTLAAARLPGADAELAATEADRLESTGEAAGALPLLERAATLAPARWEFARRIAVHHSKAGDSARTRAALARFLAAGGKASEREAAFVMWDSIK